MEPLPPNYSPSRARKRGLVIGFLALAVIAVINILGQTRRRFPIVVNRQVSAVAVNDEVAINFNSDAGDTSGVALIAATEPAFDTFLELAASEDSETLSALVLDGRLFSVPNGTKAKVLKRDSIKAKVRILDGPGQNREGWVAASLLQTR